MASNEFVDLDEIVPGTGFRKQEEPVKKKETPKEVPKEIPKEVPAKESPEPKIEIYSQDEPDEKPKSQAPEKEKKQEPKKKAEKEETKETTAKEPVKESKPEEKPKSNGNNGKKEKVNIIKEKEPVKSASPKQDKQKEPEVKKTVSKPTVQAPAKKTVLKSVKQVKKTETKKESKTISAPKKNKSQKKSNGKETNWTLIALLILAVIIIGVIAYIAIKFDFTKPEQESVVAVVNGQPIYKSELMNRYNLLKSTTNSDITEEQVLNLTITDKLLLQEAARKGIYTSDAEVKSLIEEIMIQNNIDETALKTDLSNRNISYTYLLEMYKTTLTINKLINESFSNLTLSDKELQAFYDENVEYLRIPDKVQARHILFLFGNESDQDTYDRTKEVFDMINSDKSNFCELVLKYSDDTGSNEFCGEYNFSIDYPFVPEFLEAGFNMTPGEVRIVKTQIGYHIMYKVANLPGYIPSFNEVKEDLRPALLKEKSILELNILIANLQDDAIIEMYNDSISTKRFNEVTAAKEENPDVETQENQNEVNAEEGTTGADAEAQTGVTKEVLTTPRSQKMILANCLNDKGIRMFTASWSPDSQAQLELFGEYASSLKIVECDPEAVNADLAECSKVLKKQYPTWPTWQMGETLYEGIQSLNALSKYSGCPY